MPRPPESGRRRPPERLPEEDVDRADTRPDGGSSDPAAHHGRSLLRALGLDLELPARPAPNAPALDWARSGAMALTGELDGPPRFACGPLASAARGAGLALAALAPARGFESLDGAALLGERAALGGLSRRGSASCGGSARLLPARDGVLALNLPRDADWRMLEAWLEAELPAIERTHDWSALARALAAREAWPLVRRGREIGLAVAPAIGAPDAAATPFRLALESRLAGRARGDLLRAPATFSAAHVSQAPQGRRLRVLDLSALWAGPLAGSLLAQAGCEVVKVEHPHRPDGARAGERRFFALLNAGKHACALDLGVAGERARFERLLEAADVVIESARPRALAQLGLDAGAWVSARPGRLWVSITGYGRDHEWIAFGDDAAVAAGLAFDPATPGDSRDASPRFCADAIADPLTGLTTAVAVLALRARGRGGLLSLALVDVAAHAAATRCGEDVRMAPLTLPLEQRAEGWSVHDGRGWTPVAEPRARAPRGPAPALQPPSAALLERWTGAC